MEENEVVRLLTSVIADLLFNGANAVRLLIDAVAFLR
jgi:hypothetical protein